MSFLFQSKKNWSFVIGQLTQVGSQKNGKEFRFLHKTRRLEKKKYVKLVELRQSFEMCCWRKLCLSINGAVGPHL